MYLLYFTDTYICNVFTGWFNTKETDSLKPSAS